VFKTQPSRERRARRQRGYAAQVAPGQAQRGRASPTIWLKRAKRALLALALVGALGVAAVIGANVWVWAAARHAVFDDPARLPTEEVGLVLGTIPRMADGRPYPLFEYRMDAAAALYHAGKVRHLLLSGGNPDVNYDGAADMRHALLARGVPAAAITCDHAGYRTLDSIVRARAIFGLHRVTIITQADHARRAVFIAQRLGIVAVGFGARDASGLLWLKAAVRELAARVKAVLDLYILNTRPRELGAPEPIRIPLNDR
jgi:SanA protein